MKVDSYNAKQTLKQTCLQNNTSKNTAKSEMVTTSHTNPPVTNRKMFVCFREREHGIQKKHTHLISALKLILMSSQVRVDEANGGALYCESHRHPTLVAL